MSSPTKPLPPMVAFMLNMVASSLEQAGEPELVKVFQKLKEKNPTAYKATMISLHAGMAPLKELVSSTSTLIDDGFVLAFDDAITQSATANGITLTN